MLIDKTCEYPGCNLRGGVDTHSAITSIFLRTFEVCVRISEIPICRKSLPIINETLLRLYGAADGGEKNVALSRKLMHALGNLWDLEEVSELVSALSIVQDGIAMWLEDRNGLARSEEHIEMVRPRRLILPLRFEGVL